MKHSMIGAALLCLAVVTFSNTAEAANTYKTNPVAIAFQSSSGASQYGRPGGMLISGRCNHFDSGFLTARSNGAEVLAYINPIDAYDWAMCADDNAVYGGSGASAPRWPYPSYGARRNYVNTHMLDIRKGSVLSNRIVAYVEKLMREDKVDGAFLDVVGSRLWSSMANWDSWPQWEKDAWTDGNIDLVRRIDVLRRAINPRFIVVNNNLWRGGGSDARGYYGEQYVDGVMVEHFGSGSVYHRAYVGRTFSSLGHRRVLVIGTSNADAQSWTSVQGVTHVSGQTTSAYSYAPAPPVGFNRLTDRPKIFGKASSGGSIFSPGMANNYKRGSRFTLTQKGTLLDMAAYVDGNGGVSGTQYMRMALYRDNGGVPGALVAQSNQMSINSGTGSKWLYFPSGAVALSPGTYWIMLHSGTNHALARIGGSGNANWFGNVDTYSDGAASLAGVGSLGTNTLSLFTRYTVGY